MADSIIARGQAECPRLDTLSKYDDSEPNWNDRPYFMKVEEKRGRRGWHVNVGPRDTEEKLVPAPSLRPPEYRLSPYPGYDGRTLPEMGMCLTSQGNRVVLSGIGGDEVTGGVPSPMSELQDLLAECNSVLLLVN